MCAWTKMTEVAGELLVELPDGFAGDHSHGQRDIDAARARLHRDRQPRGKSPLGASASRSHRLRALPPSRLGTCADPRCASHPRTPKSVLP